MDGVDVGGMQLGIDEEMVSLPGRLVAGADDIRWRCSHSGATPPPHPHITAHKTKLMSQLLARAPRTLHCMGVICAACCWLFYCAS